MSSRTQIVATIGPASSSPEVLEAMIKEGVDMARVNFAWFETEDEAARIDMIRAAAKASERAIPIIVDLPGPRVSRPEGHTYDASIPFSITPKDEEMLALCAEKQVEYVALSFIENAEQVGQYREAIKKAGGSQKVIAKIERKSAVDAIDEIIAASDAVMIARGDLGREVPLEEIPFVQKMIIDKANAAGKLVITATQMMLSMVDHEEPTRAEVTDVEEAVREGSGAIMLSEETASGKYPLQAVAMMERIASATEQHEAPPVPARSSAGRGTLIIARHHESEWNKQGVWTGTRDVHLTQYGFEKSGEMGALLKGVRIDNVFASMQVRSIETLSCMLNTLDQHQVPAEYSHALDERDYGEYTGKNKWDMEQLLGEEVFEHVRRDWDYPVPGGETLRQVYERVVPFYLEKVVPLLRAGRNVLIVSHGNALRALMLYVESIPKEEARNLEMLFGAVVLYQVDDQGLMQHKDVRTVESKVNA